MLKDLNSKYIDCSESVAEEAGLDSPKSIKGKEFIENRKKIKEYEMNSLN